MSENVSKPSAYAPILSETQIDRIRVFARRQPVVAGDILYQPNDETPSVFVVISGQIQIIAVVGGEDQLVTTYGPGQFSGELLMISGRRSIYRCQAVEAGELLDLSANTLRTLIARDAELSDIFMNAFLARRASLRDSGHGNVVLVGVSGSATTLALRQFLSRDGHPYAYFDVASDAAAQKLLDRF